MGSHIKKHSLEEAARLAEEEEREAERRDRRDRIYGGSKSTKSKRRPHIYILIIRRLDTRHYPRHRKHTNLQAHEANAQRPEGYTREKRGNAL